MRARPHAPYARSGIPRARRLRREATFPERLLWSKLRGLALGVRFRRQHPVGPFVVDFHAPAAALVVEVDGRSHDGRAASDAAREAALRAAGLRVLRVTNDEVLADIDGVVRRIAAALDVRAAYPSPHGEVAAQRPEGVFSAGHPSHPQKPPQSWNLPRTARRGDS